MDKHWDNEYRDGGSISSDRTFTEWDFNKLMASDKFRAVWSGNLWEIIEEGRTTVLGKFNPKTKSLYISGDKNMDNFLVVWMTENGFVNSEEYAILANGGGVGNDWFWNHAYRHYMRDASLEQRNKVKEQFIKEGLELDGESPRHAYIVVSIVSPEELKYFSKVGDNAIRFDDGGGVERIDLFEDYENIPERVQVVLDTYQDAFENGDYKQLAIANRTLERIGYTFDYGLDGQAYGLRPIGVPLNELKGYEDMGENYANGGGVGSYPYELTILVSNKDYAKIIIQRYNGIILEESSKDNGYEFALGSYDWRVLDKIADELHDKGFFISQYANGGAIKTDFNELENTELRNVLISFWNDFFNNPICNYLSIQKENYILSNIDNVFVIVRDEDKGIFSDIEKQNIDMFLSPYFDSDKKPLFTEFFNKYKIKDNKIIIYIKEGNMYANGGGVEIADDYADLRFASKQFSKTAEMLVRENFNNGEICMCKLTKILGHEPNYPIQIVGSLKLEKCFMKRFYKLA